jgi:hypothetical protein
MIFGTMLYKPTSFFTLSKSFLFSVVNRSIFNVKVSSCWFAYNYEYVPNYLFILCAPVK